MTTQINQQIKQNYEFCPALIIDINEFVEKPDFPTCSHMIHRAAFAFGAWADQYLSFCPREIRIQEGRLNVVDVKGFA